MLASTMLFSCQQENEPAPAINGPKDGMIEWTANINLPDNFRTRAADSFAVGSDGLYTFNREIDKLWYGVYYDGAYFYDCTSENAPVPQKIEDGKFTVLFKFNNNIDPSKVYLFFWAGNESDNVTTNDVQTVTDGINLNFQKRCVSVDPKYMNGNNIELKEYDSFASYVQLSTSNNVTDYNKSVTLKRPFAQIHVLSDEFTGAGGTSGFENGLTVVPGFGVETATKSNYTNNLLSPTTWYFDDSINASPVYKKNEFSYSLTNYEHTNSWSGTSPERVTFKGRNMDYLGCYYVFAPIIKSPLKYAEATSNFSVLGKVNLAFRDKNKVIANSDFVSVELPSEGIQANNRYVIYNKSTSEGGTGGFLTSNFVFEIVTDPEWNEDKEISK